MPSLSRERFLNQTFSLLGIAVLERKAKGQFRSIGALPDWLRQIIPVSDSESDLRLSEWFPYLENFLIEAEELWSGAKTGMVRSGTWVEQVDGFERHLEASALGFDSQQILLLQDVSNRLEERRDLLQKARENLLIYRRFQKEIQEKEILLHCVVHDLGGPLMGVAGTLALLGKEPISERGQRRLQIAQEAATKLEDSIKSILDVFRATAQVESEGVRELDPMESAKTVIAVLEPSASLKNIRLELDGPKEGARCLVAAEQSRLERVFFNLLDNALRYTPNNKTVCLRLVQTGTEFLVEVRDQGPGVPDSEVPHLFKQFWKSAGKSGKAGLGLFFCRIVIDRWGGTIGYSKRRSGGACFWFKLPLSPVPRVDQRVGQTD